MKILRLTICFILVLGFKTLASSNYAVLLQESPAGAGQIDPGAGVHTYGVNETVTLTTVANPGWKFVCWLGEVSDKTTNRTMMSVDGPKIIIAVFARDEFVNLKPGEAFSAGQGILTPRYDAIGGDLGSGSGPPPSNPHYDYPSTPTPPDMPPPVPPEVPEPATMLLLGIGAGLLTINRNKLMQKNLLKKESCQ
jgi:PEP-CTERM motif/Divergent InlB B-repeat domain